MEEENLDELKKPTPETAAKVVDRADNRDEWSPKAANRLYSAYKKRYEPKPEKEMKEAKKAWEEEIDYSAPDRPAVTKDNKPSTPAQTNASTSGPSDADKKALDSKIKTIAKEEVSFSQAEIDHINSFFLEAPVAPSRPEVAVGADSTSDKMSQNDVTGTAESGKKKIKEESDAADETNMAKTQLKAMATKSMDLHKKLKVSKNLPAWVQSKLAVAKDGVTAVHDFMNHSDKIKEETIVEGRPKKNPTPETTERDARQHIQVQAGRAAGGTVVDFKHDNGKISKLTPGMGRAVIAHLNALKPAERQEAVKRMHASPEGLKV